MVNEESGCGTSGRDCCPLGKHCNLSKRYKITPNQLDDKEPIFPKSLPKYAKANVLPDSAGVEYFDSSLTMKPCGVRDRECYKKVKKDGKDTGKFSDELTPGIDKLDEFYTACGYGNSLYWPSGQIRHHGHFRSPAWSIITDGREGYSKDCSDFKFETPEGFDYVESSECKIKPEKILTTTADKNLGSYTGGASVIGGIGALGAAGTAGVGIVGGALAVAASPFIILGGTVGATYYSQEYDENSTGCHYKYKKNWDHERWGTDKIDEDTGIPKLRMACCTSFNEDGKYEPLTDSNGNEVICPLTTNATLIYSNNDIEEYGAGVYDPASNVCARYNTDNDTPDTPDKWCSHNITKNNADFTIRGGIPVKPASSDTSWYIKYSSYIKLLTDTSCIRWLELDYNDIATDPAYPHKPRSKALGNELKNFFIWVSAHLADKKLTPATITKSPNGLRSDLIQAENKMNNFSQDGCPPGTSEATKYIGDKDLDAEEMCEFINDLNHPIKFILNLECQNQNVIESESECKKIQDFLQHDNCEKYTRESGKIYKCDDDNGGYKCTEKFYSKVDGTTKTYHPCYQYKNINNEWKAETITSDIIDSIGSVSESGCGYYPADYNINTVSSEILEIWRDQINEKFKGRTTEELRIMFPNFNGNTDGMSKSEIIDTYISNGFFDHIYEDIFGVEKDYDPSRCINDNDQSCCNYLNNEFDLAKLIKEQKERTLFDTNFNASTDLGRFLNFLTTHAAGAFLHHSDYSKNIDNTDNEFIKNMKLFCARDDIFDWKQIDSSDSSDTQGHAKKYNDLLKERYSKICNCFWKWTGGTFSEDGNPVKEAYKMHNKFDACRSINDDNNACNTPNPNNGCGLLNPDEKETCIKKKKGKDSIINQIIYFYDNKDPSDENNASIQIDNACWYHPCWSGLHCNDDYTFRKEYGLTTKYTKAVEKQAECNDGSCKYACIAQNIVESDSIIIQDGGKLDQTIHMNCFQNYKDDPDSGKMCGLTGKEDPTKTYTEGGTIDIDNDRDHSPSPSPSPSEPSSSFFAFDEPWKIVVAVVAAVAAVIFAMWVISQFSNDEGESKGEGKKSEGVVSDTDMGTFYNKLAVVN